MKKVGFFKFEDRQYSLKLSLPLVAMNCLGSIVAFFFIDDFGRRKLMLISLPFCAGAILFLSGGLWVHYETEYHYAGSLIILISIMIFLGVFSIGMGCTPQTVNSEIYPLYLRSIGNATGTSINFIANYMESAIFLTITKNS